MRKRKKYRFHPKSNYPEITDKYTLVFPSNMLGIHRTELSEIAHSTYLAETGVFFGLSGNAYAIPVKDRLIRALSLAEIAVYVNQFKEFTYSQPNRLFWILDFSMVRRSYSSGQFASLFRGANTNCSFPKNWKYFL